jgi:hypothetical protein
MSKRRRARILVLSILVLGLGCLAPGCRPPNLPESMRWWLFSNFGANQMCPEMLKHSMTLRFSERQPGIGRFFPTQCTHQVNDAAHTVTVHVTGTGYGFMAPAKRVGFSIQASVEYRPDFWFVDDDAYVWAKLNRVVNGPNFQLGYVENPVIDVAANIPPFGNIANFIGDQVVKGQMTRGFTVVRNLDTDTDTFSLGIVEPPNRPFTPYDVSKSERLTYANETVDVNVGQRDYLGPFEVVDTDQALYLQMGVVGPPVDVIVVDKVTGDLWRESYQLGRPLGPPPGPVMTGFPLQAGPDTFQRLKLPPGVFYVVIDNTSGAGIVQPPMASINPFVSPVARVTYLAQLGE